MQRNDIFYHVGFDTIEHQYFFVDNAVRLAIENFIKGWLAAKGINCRIVSCQWNHVHMMVSAKDVQWNAILCALQKALTSMLHHEFKGMPRYIWVYDWWFRRVRHGDESIVFNYISHQDRHHHSR